MKSFFMFIGISLVCTLSALSQEGYFNSISLLSHNEPSCYSLLFEQIPFHGISHYTCNIDESTRVVDITAFYSSKENGSEMSALDTIPVGKLTPMLYVMNVTLRDMDGMCPDNVFYMPLLPGNKEETILFQNYNPYRSSVAFDTRTPSHESGDSSPINIRLLNDSLYIDGTATANCCGFHFIKYSIDDEKSEIRLRMFETSECNCVDDCQLAIVIGPCKNPRYTVQVEWIEDYVQTTSIQNIRTQPSNEMLFDTFGRPTDKSHSNLYIQGGKKVFIP